jgi:multidrug efflux pump subunit AcrA (membrane-fusion protein)
MTTSRERSRAELDNPAAGGAETGSAAVRLIVRVVTGLVVLAVLGAAGAVSVYWMRNKPTAHRRRPESQAALVEVEAVTFRPMTVVIQAMGTVVPAKTIQLSSEVSGRVIEVDPEFVPGGSFKAGQAILRVKREDYELGVAQAEASLAAIDAQLEELNVDEKNYGASLEIEETSLDLGEKELARKEGLHAQRLIADSELEQEKRTVLAQRIKVQQIENSLALIPAKRRALDAQRAVSEAKLKDARLDLARTVVRAPFNAVVQTRSVDLGSQVNVGSGLASLVGTDEFWAQASVPVDELRWIDVPGPDKERGSTVRVYYEAAWGRDAYRTGTVARLMTNLETQGRMARLLVSVKDPLGLGVAPADRRALMLDSYVRVEIQGRTLERAVAVPRTALREGNRVWAMGTDGRLEIMEVKIVWSGKDYVYVTNGLTDGQRLVTSDLGTPVQGMALRAAGTAPGLSYSDAEPASGRHSALNDREDPK